MPNTIKRHFLKEKETEKILQALSRKLNIDIEQVLGSKPRIELAEIHSTQIFIINGKPALARVDDMLLPTLTFDEIFPFLPKIVVDMGAVPHVCSGADVMAPGVVRVDRDFNENDVLLIADEQHGKPLAIGIALVTAQYMRKLTQGKVVKNVHYVGDKLWNLLNKMR